MKGSKIYARQTKYIDQDETWNGGNFFMILIILQYIKYRCSEPYGVKGDELDTEQRAIKTARRIIGFKTDESNNDVKIDTMTNLSCVPAIILLNGALHHYGLKTIYFHPEKTKDELLSMHQRALMSQTIRFLIKEPELDELEKKFAKQNRKKIGYTRAQVLNTTHKTGQRAADKYIDWCNRHKFDHMPDITVVHETEVVDPSTVPEIQNKYPDLRPTPVLPVDEASEPEVEDESLNSYTAGEESPPTVNVENLLTQVKPPKTPKPAYLQSVDYLVYLEAKKNTLAPHKQQRSVRALQLQNPPGVAQTTDSGIATRSTTARHPRCRCFRKRWK